MRFDNIEAMDLLKILWGETGQQRGPRTLSKRDWDVKEGEIYAEMASLPDVDTSDALLAQLLEDVGDRTKVVKEFNAMVDAVLHGDYTLPKKKSLSSTSPIHITCSPMDPSWTPIVALSTDNSQIFVGSDEELSFSSIQVIHSDTETDSDDDDTATVIMCKSQYSVVEPASNNTIKPDVDAEATLMTVDKTKTLKSEENNLVQVEAEATPTPNDKTKNSEDKNSVQRQTNANNEATPVSIDKAQTLHSEKNNAVRVKAEATLPTPVDKATLELFKTKDIHEPQNPTLSPLSLPASTEPDISALIVEPNTSSQTHLRLGSLIKAVKEINPIVQNVKISILANKKGKVEKPFLNYKIPLKKRKISSATEKNDKIPLKRKIISESPPKEIDSILPSTQNSIMENVRENGKALRKRETRHQLSTQDKADNVENQEPEKNPKKRQPSKTPETAPAPVKQELEENAHEEEKTVTRLKQYVKKAAKLPTCSKAELFKNLRILREEYDAEPLKRDIDQIRLIMEETFKLRFNEIHNSINLVDIGDAIFCYPALAIPEYLPFEYSMQFPEKLTGKKFRQKIRPLMNKMIDTALVAGHKKRTATSTLALKGLRENNTDKMRLIVGSILLVEEKSKGKANGTFYFQSKNPPREQPCIKVNKNLNLWDEGHPMHIYVEGLKTGCKVVNFYEALLCVYYYFWIFDLQYDPTLDELIFEAFDNLSRPGGNFIL